MVELCVGTQSNGQGHETAFAQILVERSGIPFEKIRFVQGDSDRIADGGGTGGSRSATMQGNSINHAADEVIARFRPLAEDELEVGERRPGLRGRRLPRRRHRPGDRPDASSPRWRARDGQDRAAQPPPREFVVPGRSYPNGAHFAEVEIELETGRTAVVKYTVVDDFGYLINPMLAEGQVHGGVAQGIGQAVTEQVSFSPEGQLLSGSFMDYAMPRANDVPFMAFHTELVPSTANADRHEGLRRGRHRRRAGRGHQRRARRGLGGGRAPRRHAADPGPGLGLAAGGGRRPGRCRVRRIGSVRDRTSAAKGLPGFVVAGIRLESGWKVACHFLTGA